MSFKIRNYTNEDAPELRRIFLEARQKAFLWADSAEFDLADFDLVTRDETILVATENESPIGFIAWWPPENFIHSLFIDPSFAGKGAGKLLLNACLLELGRPARLKCLQANVHACAFYTAQGWEIARAGESEEGDYYVLTFY
ncbi:GNAT family N-acetyltransferase [Dyadobacter sp. LJ53]|uniref:GNAT family N-acetyltransferase n=1 Tax=Dyadobacter chenwenxiniae TaxID=2906456 RepID=UPI001F30FC8C|nr:GNAT family N-acetyltransferase [Dyadobacter chenwenxiniae]MCF0049358.1 GNAT family N-acetyltransferase [Dyadobacter chenwenxiniae]